MKALVIDRSIAEFTYSAKELTIDEIRVWLRIAEQASASQDIVGQMLFDDLSLSDISYLTTLTREQIGKLTPSQVLEVWTVCQETNSDFFHLRGRLLQLGKASLVASAATSNSPSLP